MLLGVNVDHVATVREARKEGEPDPLMAARLAIKGGADGITVHLREDRRHINDRDLQQVRRHIKNVEINLEMAATKEMIAIALKVRPEMVTLVPEKRAELTTEGGLDLKKSGGKIARAIDAIQSKGIPVSLFINPAIKDVDLSKKLGATLVEIHTGLFANAKGKKQTEALIRVRKAVKRGIDSGLLMNAGHGLKFTNVKRIAAIKGIRGLYIGHSIIANAIYLGIEEATRQMKKLIRDSSCIR
jgi:pyridoxine 5-phosphate synthase